MWTPLMYHETMRHSERKERPDTARALRHEVHILQLPYFSIDNGHPKLFRHSFWCIDNVHDAN